MNPLTAAQALLDDRTTWSRLLLFAMLVLGGDALLRIVDEVAFPPLYFYGWGVLFCLNVLALGWLMQLSKNRAADTLPVVPAWDGLARKLVDGLQKASVLLFYSLPTVLIVLYIVVRNTLEVVAMRVVEFGFAFFVALLTLGVGWEDPEYSAVALIPIPWVWLQFLLVLMLPLIGIAWAVMAQTGRTVAGFAFPKHIGLARDNRAYTAYLLLWTWGGGAFLWMLGFISGYAVLVTLVVALPVAAYALGEYARALADDIAARYPPPPPKPKPEAEPDDNDTDPA